MILPGLILLDLLCKLMIDKYIFDPSKYNAVSHFHKEFIYCRKEERCNLKNCEKEINYKKVKCLDSSHYCYFNQEIRINRVLKDIDRKNVIY